MKHGCLPSIFINSRWKQNHSQETTSRCSRSIRFIPQRDTNKRSLLKMEDKGFSASGGGAFQGPPLPPLLCRSKKRFSPASIIPDSKTSQKLLFSLLFSLSSATIDLDWNPEHFGHRENTALTTLCARRRWRRGGERTKPTGSTRASCDRPSRC